MMLDQIYTFLEAYDRDYPRHGYPSADKCKTANTLQALARSSRQVAPQDAAGARVAWQAVPWLALSWAEDLLPLVDGVRKKAAADGRAMLWCHPETHQTAPEPSDTENEPWVPIKAAEWAVEDVGRPIGHALQIVPNAANRLVGGPTPLASMLAGGLLGAGLGHAGGWLGEKAVGDDVLEPGKLRRTGRITGALLGLLPGLALGGLGMAARSDQGKNPWSAWVEPNLLAGQKQASEEEEIDQFFLVRRQPGGFVSCDDLSKRADEDMTGIFVETIPVDAFNRVVWRDPYLTMPMRAAASGLVESASQVQGGIPTVSPFDVARIAVGMGSGLLSGIAVGRVLGAVAGLHPEAQNKLQQAGAIAGLIKAVVPMAYGR